MTKNRVNELRKKIETLNVCKNKMEYLRDNTVCIDLVTSELDSSIDLIQSEIKKCSIELFEIAQKNSGVMF
jgi:ribosomal protein L32